MAGEPILIVDDTPVNLKLTRILLEHEGYEIRTATSAEEALALLETFRPKLVLADIQMPGMDGLEMTRRIKADPRNRGMLVVALTAFAMKGDEERAIEAGCDGYITKPIDTRAMGDRIRGYLKDGESKPSVPDAFPSADIGDLRSRFLQEARTQVPMWIDELTGFFDAGHAQAIAHQWIGSGGLLGFLNVSKLARETEAILREKPLDSGELLEALKALNEELQNPTIGEDPTVAPPSGPAPAGTERPLVLLVDDDPNIRVLVKAFLESQAIECRTIADGGEALAAIRDQKPRAVVLDVNMPGMSGYEVLAAIRAEALPVKVVLLTADENPRTEGADDFLVKPFNPVDLVVKLKKLL